VCTCNSTLPINDFCTALLLPRVHWIGTEMALRDHGNCKLCLYCSSFCVSVYWLLLMVCLLKNVDLICLEPNWKIGYILCKMQCFIIASIDQTTWFGRKFFCSPCRSTVTGVLFGSFTMVGSQIREGKWASNLSEFTCQWSYGSIVVSFNLVALSWFLSCPGLNLAEILFRSFALVG
jgi:hypothetical protein